MVERTNGKRKNKVLIVDDTPENLRVLGEILTKDGHEVRVAINGNQGLEIARSTSIDLILLDVMMPDLNGYEVCLLLKKDAKTKDVPVIFLTALDSPEDEARGLDLGAVDYIAKPFKVELVRTRIANQLELHNARLDLRRHNEELDLLVAERSQELAEAHRKLKTVDAAKYDFLQVIYRKLWGTEASFVTLSSKAWGLTDPNHPDLALSREQYEACQRDLFDTVRNALLMTNSGQAPRTRLSSLEALLPEIRDRAQSLLAGRSVLFAEPSNWKGSNAPLSGDRDLLVQSLSTLARVAGLLALPGVPVVESVEVESDQVRPGSLCLVWSGAGVPPEGEELTSLFHPEEGMNSSKVGLALGLDLPLAVKILLVMGGSPKLVLGADGWQVRALLPIDPSGLAAYK